MKFMGLNYSKRIHETFQMSGNKNQRKKKNTKLIDEKKNFLSLLFRQLNLLYQFVDEKNVMLVK